MAMTISNDLYWKMLVVSLGLSSRLYPLSNAPLGATYDTRVERTLLANGMAIFLAAPHGRGWSGAGPSE